ncbi:hypothetical protein Hanom_Chr06g00482911 [Helianthus anomalus]
MFGKLSSFGTPLDPDPLSVSLLFSTLSTKTLSFEPFCALPTSLSTNGLFGTLLVLSTLPFVTSFETLSFFEGSGFTGLDCELAPDVLDFSFKPTFGSAFVLFSVPKSSCASFFT